MRRVMLRSLKDKHRNGSGKTLWHLVVADYYSAKSLVFFLALIYMSILQFGILKMAGEQAEKKPVEKVELVLAGDGKMLVIKDGRHIPIAEKEVKDIVKDKDVVYHTAEIVTTSEYGILYVRYLKQMDTANGITPGRAIKIER